MPRQPRFVLPGQPQHVIVRGNNRSNTFCRDDDYLLFLEILQEAALKFECKIHAYVLMTNHVHMLITPESEIGISKVMQSLGRRYVQYFNKRYNRTGTLWEGRFKASLIDSEAYALICYRYIELNPVRAYMVTHPGEYRWSSYHKNANGKHDSLVSPHDLYNRLGNNRADRCASYRSLFGAKIAEQTLVNIRDATNGCWALVEGKFDSRTEADIGRPVSPQKRGGDRRSKAFNRV